MAEIDKKKILKIDVQSIKEFAENRGVTTQSVHYAIGQDFIDWVKVGFETLIVMTKKTQEYLEVPRRSENGRRMEKLEL